MILISIIIPVYNCEKYIQKCLNSVLLQSVKEIEIICIDDGSKDNSLKLLYEIAKKDTRILVLTHENRGVSYTRNRGLQQARGQYIAFIDADDIWHADTLSTLLVALQGNSRASIAWAKYLRFESETKIAIPTIAKKPEAPSLWHALLIENFLPIGTFLLRASIIKEQFFDTTLTIGEDRDWLLRILKGEEDIFVNNVLLYYRQHSTNSVHNYERFIIDENIFMEKYLQSTDIPNNIKKRAFSFLYFHTFIMYLKQNKCLFKAIENYLKAIACDPINYELYFRPFRKIYYRYAKKIKLNI